MWNCAEARQVGRAMFLTFARQFPEDVNGVLKNVETSLAIKLRHQAQEVAKSSPVPSPNGSTRHRPSTAPGGVPAAAYGPARSIRLHTADGSSTARRPSKLNTAPPTESARPRPPSVSPKPAAKSRASIGGGSRLQSESSTMSASSAFSLFPEQVHLRFRCTWSALYR